jgi:SAM-dependent methyltransferase
LTNVEFHLATIDRLPLPDRSADCIISNCVINLAPDKPAVFREMYRVLKPGGRVAVSDIALKKPLPAEIGQDILAYVGCIAGAILLGDYERQLREAGFSTVQVIDTAKDLNAYALAGGSSACCSAPVARSYIPVSCCSAPRSASDTLPLAQTDGDALHERLAQLLARYDVSEFAASVQVYAIKT